MNSLLFQLGVLFGLTLVPLGLSGLTAWMWAPAHMMLAALVMLGSVGAGLGGHRRIAGGWLLLYLLASVLSIAAIDVGVRLDPERSFLGWPAPFAWVYGWIPVPVAAAGMGLAGWRQRVLARNAAYLRRRRAVRVQ